MSLADLAQTDTVIPDDLRGLWDIGRWCEVEELSGGAVNRVFSVRTSAGRYVLRRYRAGTPSQLNREARVTTWVRRHGLPAIAPIISVSGELHVERDGVCFALFPFADGAQKAASDLTLKDAAAAGDMLGRLHGVLGGLPTAEWRPPRLLWDRSAWEQRLTVLEHAILGRSEADGRDEIALARVRAQRAWMAHPDCRHSHDLGDGLQVTHGDYHHGNLFFDEGQVSAVIDWEQMALLPRAYEAVRAATYMFDGQPERTAVFLSSWRQVSGASADELAQGAAAFSVVRDHWVWPLEEVYLFGNDRARRYIPDAPYEPFSATWAQIQTAP
ncbi:phosphotransferase [Phenylobacterium sp.]|jgi:homoserine kinase type II|uniref:phosphotransferase enzyme family protein n=1 Tax=Phenylobacterium sp. TaxID=1871053 RepID=UPI000C927955|nr:phosphotransferase [Phenylobacterium sp.]MAK80419.1 serine kinase [Phenylobacterium sp.]|tara:strand:- start:10766 stop:11749 length:984 start_codon:yes stop_codon:yes gene_type:complete